MPYAPPSASEEPKVITAPSVPTKRVLEGIGVGEEQSSLAEIVEEQRRQNDTEPAEADRQAAEMAHIRIHCLGAGEREKGGAEHGKTDARSGMSQKDQRVVRAGRAQDRRCREDTAQAEQTDRDEPYQHHRSEDVADECSPLALDQKQTDKDRDADWNDERCQPRGVELETFDGAQHRDRRRDDAVAIKQRRTDQPDNQEKCTQASGRRVPDVEER